MCDFAKYAHHRTLYMHFAYSHPLNEHCTQHCSLHSLLNTRQFISAIFSSNKISQSNIPYRPSSCTPHAVSAFKTDHICHGQHSNYIGATHNITHSPCTSTCTPHPAIPTSQPSTTLLCTQLTNTKHSWQNATRCRDGVKLLWSHFHLVCLVFQGSIPACACHSENFFVTL